MVFQKFKRELEVNGIEILVDVTIEVLEDEFSEVEGSFDFGDETENEKYLARFKSGELFNSCITVKATAEGETGSDSLGACHIHSNNMFDSAPFNTDVNDTVKEHEMIGVALDDLKNSIIRRANNLKQYATK